MFNSGVGQFLLQFYIFYSCYLFKKKDMGNDTCGLLADCPKAKKSKTVEYEEEYTSNWAYLPSVVMHDVLSLLNHKDRINASSTCRNWRQNFYHPYFWQKATIKLSTNTFSDNCYGLVIARIVQNVTIKFESLSPSCVSEFITLLQHLSHNTNLQSLLFEPTHCQIVLPFTFNLFVEETNTELVQTVLKCCSLSLKQFSIGGCELLSHHVLQILTKLAEKNSDQVTLLGLASIKEDPLEYIIAEIKPYLFATFKNLEVLSVDYDILNDDILNSLQDANRLNRLVVHVHGVCSDHPGTSDEAWINFKHHHPNCELRMSFIHSYDEIRDMHNSILRQHMPLSYFKVYFCEEMNTDALKMLATWYSKTLRSIVWVDSLRNDFKNISHTLVRLCNTEPDPIVMAAWTCTKLEEVVLLGYQYFEESLIAIARLRSDTLKVLEVASENITSTFDDACREHMNSQREISSIIGKPWAPLQRKDMHPVLYSSLAGDSDEYILPKVLADLY